MTFTNLRKFRLKLNPDKCTFGVPAGKLLGFLVSSRGIEANPTKIRAIESIKLPRCLRDVQKFTECLASLSRFVGRLGEKALPLYQLMNKIDRFTWTLQADAVFHELKKMWLQHRYWPHHCPKSRCCSILQPLTELLVSW